MNSDWNNLKLGDVCEFTQGVQIPYSEQNNVLEDGYIRYLYIRDFFTDDFKCYVKDLYPTKIMNKKDIMMVNTGNTAGSVYRGAFGVLCNNAFKITTNEDVLNKDFLFMFLSSSIYTNIIKRYFNYGGQPHVGHKNVAKIPISIPPLKEQEKITQILSQWDEAIETAQNLINQLQLRKKGLMQEVLTGKKRLAGYSEGWKKMSIGDVATQFTGKNKDNEDIEVLSCTKYDGLVTSLQYFGRKVYGDDLSKYKIVPRGYFAYATNHIEEGSIGYQNIWDKGLVSPMYTVFKTDENIDDSFFFRLLKTDRMIYSYQSNMSGSIARRGGLRWNVFETLIIKIPSYKEQVAIANVFDKVDEEIDTASKHLESLKQQKKGLMQQLLTGKKRVKI